MVVKEDMSGILHEDGAVEIWRESVCVLGANSGPIYPRGCGGERNRCVPEKQTIFRFLLVSEIWGNVEDGMVVVVVGKNEQFKVFW